MRCRSSLMCICFPFVCLGFVVCFLWGSIFCVSGPICLHQFVALLVFVFLVCESFDVPIVSIVVIFLRCFEYMYRRVLGAVYVCFLVLTLLSFFWYCHMDLMLCFLLLLLGVLFLLPVSCYSLCFATHICVRVLGICCV